MPSYKYYAKFRLTGNDKWHIDTFVSKREAINKMEEGKKGKYL